MHEDADNGLIDNGPAVVSVRTMEIATAIVIMGFAALVMVSNYRLGAAWGSDGPQPGYFPFYIGVLMFISGGAVLAGQLLSRAGRAAPQAAASFVDRHSLWRVLQILIPTAVYVVFIVYLGIYVASAIFIALFMLWFGRYRIYVAVPLAIAISLALFITFEIWFLVPLPKGPLELWLGY